MSCCDVLFQVVTCLIMKYLFQFVTCSRPVVTCSCPVVTRLSSCDVLLSGCDVLVSGCNVLASGGDVFVRVTGRAGVRPVCHREAAGEVAGAVGRETRRGTVARGLLGSSRHSRLQDSPDMPDPADTLDDVTEDDAGRRLLVNRLLAAALASSSGSASSGAGRRRRAAGECL